MLVSGMELRKQQGCPIRQDFNQPGLLRGITVNKWKIGAAMRLYMVIMAAVMGLGIWLTGINTVHWLLYVPVIIFVLAAITGICPGMFLTRNVAGGKGD